MTVYKVEFFTLSRGKDPLGQVGNLKQSDEIAYIECRNTSRVEVLLEEYYKTPNKHGRYLVPVIQNIKAVKGFCVTEGE